MAAVWPGNRQRPIVRSRGTTNPSPHNRPSVSSGRVCDCLGTLFLPWNRFVRKAKVVSRQKKFRSQMMDCLRNGGLCVFIDDPRALSNALLQLHMMNVTLHDEP